MTDPFVYVSLGAGVQSTALLACSVFGLHGVPRAEVAIFADTQAEPRFVYEHLERLKGISDIRIDVVTAGDLGRDSVGTFMRLPAFTVDQSGDKGMVRRQCTREYKIVPIQRHVRALLGVEPRRRVRRPVVALVGISRDEIGRVAPSRDKWIERRHPLVDADLSRQDCVRILERVGWPVPKKSACYFCPFHDDAYWRDLREHYPDEWAKAVAFDAAIRNSSKAVPKQPMFLHAARQPLGDVELKPEYEMPLFDRFTEECAGVCGV